MTDDDKANNINHLSQEENCFAFRGFLRSLTFARQQKQMFPSNGIRRRITQSNGIPVAHKSWRREPIQTWSWSRTKVEKLITRDSPRRGREMPFATRLLIYYRMDLRRGDRMLRRRSSPDAPMIKRHQFAEIYEIFWKIVSPKRGNIETKRAGRKLGNAIDWRVILLRQWRWMKKISRKFLTGVWWSLRRRNVCLIIEELRLFRMLPWGDSQDFFLLTKTTNLKSSKT